MKKTLVLVGCIMALLFAGNQAQAASKHVLKMAHTTLAAPSAPADAIKEFAARVTKETDGRITFKIFSSELADWAECNEMVLRGELDILLDPMATTFDPRWAAMQFPYLVTDYADAEAIFGPSGFMNNLFKKWADEKGMIWLGTWMQGFTGLSLNSAATTPEEAKGIKIRSTPVGLIQYVWRELGFNVSILPYSEVPTAISTGVVSGQAGGGPAQSWNLVRDINKYYLHYRDSLELWGFVINKDKWNSIDPADQVIMQKAADDMVAKRVTAAEIEENADMEKLAKHGLIVIDLIDYPEKLAKSKELGRKTWPRMEELLGKENMDVIRASLKE